MNISSQCKQLFFASLLTFGLAACGGGGGGNSNNPVDDMPPDNTPPSTPPTASKVDFGATLSELVGEGEATLPDGETYNSDSAPIHMSDYEWEIDNNDVDESPLDDVFSS